MSTDVDRLTTALADRYTIERELGAGGMATVFLATDLKHHRPVAIKVLRPELAAVLGAERFLHEIEITANLQHPHILPLFDSGEADSFLFYVMPFVEGESLRDFLTRKTTLPIAQAVGLMHDISAALAHAHDHGIVHRDIKPENVLLVDGEALLADFGIALAVSTADSTRLTGTGLAVGTPTYMSPEQITGHGTVDHRSDIYALGCLLYEMLTGEPPFTGPTMQAVIAHSLADEPPHAHAARADVPPVLDAAIHRALAKLPEKRFASAREFADAITLPVERAPARTWVRVAVAALVVIVTGLGFSAWQNARAAAARDTLPRIAQLAAEGAYAAAYQLAVAAERVIPTDPRLDSLMAEVSDVLSVTTSPLGARIVISPFTADGSQPPPVFEGVSPVGRLRIARVDHVVRATLDGYVPSERIAESRYRRASKAWGETPPENGRAIPLEIPLLLDEGNTHDMVAVPGGPYQLVGPDVPPHATTMLSDYLIDKFEVTNAAFHAFVLGGGYRDDQYWRDTPTGIRTTLIDRTGLAGPRLWVGQHFPEGQDQHPVTSVTWYEATAFCRARDKRLPTIFEWEKADRDGRATTGVFMPWGYMATTTTIENRANFNSDGPKAVTEYPFGMSQYGVYAMAGNAKEWLANQMGDGHAVTGGSWEDPSYLYSQYGSQPGLFASGSLGFRCASSRNGDDAGQGVRPIDLDERTPEYSPVDSATFHALLTHYQYDRQPANPRGRSTSETDGWTRERLWIGGVGGDSVLVYFYVPTQASPPYQTMVYVPNSSPFCCSTLPEGAEYTIGPMIQSGRAALAIVFKGMLERRRPPGHTPPATSSVRFRDEMVLHATELRLGIDYLEERGDVDLSRIAYVGVSWGAGSRLGFAAVDDRFRSFVFIGGGIDERAKPTLPEADNVNFAPYIDGPKLLLNGRNDEEHVWFARGLPLWNLLRQPKELVLVHGAGHVPPPESRVPAVNAFLDRTLGPVIRR